MIVRGIKHASDRFINELSAKYLSLPMTNKKNGKVTIANAQVQVRPVQLYEVVFPKEQLDVMLQTLFPLTDGSTAYKKFQTIVRWAKRLMGLKPIPKEWNRKNHMLVCKDGVEIIGIGLKDDRVLDFKRSKEAYKGLGLDPNGEYESEGL